MSDQLSEFFISAINTAIKDSIKQSLLSFDSPIVPLLKRVFAAEEARIEQLVRKALDAALSDPNLEEEIQDAVRHKIAKSLILGVEGEIDRRVTKLREDPMLRARIINGIEAIIKKG